MPGKDTIVLRNTIRRPLTFHVSGVTVRLAPGERVEIPAQWIATPDMQRVAQAGLIVNESAQRPSSGAAPADQERDEAPKPPKHKPSKHEK